MSAALRALLKFQEGVRLQVYDDATGKPITSGSTLIGHPTIGVGRALDTNGITKEEAYALLDADIARAFQKCKSLIFFAGLDEVRRDVVVCMVFNLGFGGFMQFRRVNEALSRKDYDRAASEMLNSKWASQVGRRAVVLANMMRTGTYPEQ